MAKAQDRLQSRRSVLRVAASLFALGGVARLGDAAGQSSSSEVPDAGQLAHGDLVWPKRPSAIVPYDSSTASAADQLKKQWLQERDAFIRAVRENQRSPKELRQLATNFEAMTYEEFYLRYNADVLPSEILKYGAFDDLFSVGHVGIVDVASDGEKFVLEAVWGGVKKVQRVSYAQWIKDRSGSWVWLGRLKYQSADDLQKFVAQARTYLSRPYDFWNFDLADDSSFYCSKLVWLSLAKALDVYLDNDRNSKRSFWYSPKQAWNSPFVVRVNQPRNFTY